MSCDAVSSVFLQLVADEGGFDLVCRDRRWTKIALQMGFAPGKAIGSHLRAHYEKVLYPYNLFQSGANLLVSGPPHLTRTRTHIPPPLLPTRHLLTSALLTLTNASWLSGVKFEQRFALPESILKRGFSREMYWFMLDPRWGSL